MAVMNVNPTRMELSRLKKQLSTATRGHKLLKDKRDELMRQFLDTIRETKTLREEFEERLKDVNSHFVMASSLMSKETMDVALMAPKQEVYLEASTRNVMSVEIPVYDISTRTSESSDIFSYGFASTSFELDDAVEGLAELLPMMLKLAEREKAVKLMADEIEKTRRRVNALEHVMIPRYKDTIHFIAGKLEENERSSRARLMKVKDMMIAEQIEHKKSNPDAI
ncbi:MAG: V-type ATP synthase subunit D [Clostridia bacterium]|nr:V-type ATP synthase subunit D [Clostridia bacterium]